MKSESKTLYIPLYAKAYVSGRGLILHDEHAERIWDTEGFPLGRRARSKWLAFFLGMRARVFDEWVRERVRSERNVAVLHIGCGMDARVMRIGARFGTWYDIDFPEVISERRKYFDDGERYCMIGADLRSHDFLSQITEKHAVVILEGVSMYVSADELKGLFSALGEHFESYEMLLDTYSVLAAKMSKLKNPVHGVGVSTVTGVNCAEELLCEGLSFVGGHEMTPARMIDELSGTERFWFRTLYGGKLARSLYRIYEYAWHASHKAPCENNEKESE